MKGCVVLPSFLGARRARGVPRRAPRQYLPRYADFGEDAPDVLEAMLRRHPECNRRGKVVADAKTRAIAAINRLPPDKLGGARYSMPRK